MYSTTDFRKGLKIDVEGTPYEIVDFQHFKPGKGGAMVRTKNQWGGAAFFSYAQQITCGIIPSERGAQILKINVIFLCLFVGGSENLLPQIAL